MRNYKTIWSLQGDEWPETNCYLGTAFFMFSSLSADKNSYNYSLFRARRSINRRENKAGTFPLLFLIAFHMQTRPGKSRGVWDLCLGPAQIQPGQATASRNSAEPAPPWTLGDGVNNPSLRGRAHREVIVWPCWFSGLLWTLQNTCFVPLRLFFPGQPQSSLARVLPTRW